MNSNDATPKLIYDNARIKVKFNGNLLKQDKVTYNHGPIYVHIVYRLVHATINTDIVLKNCLFGAAKVTNTSKPDTDNWQCSCYGICFDSTGALTHTYANYGRNVIIFGDDLSNSKHATNKTQSVLVLGHGLIQKIDGTTIYAEKMYLPNSSLYNKTVTIVIYLSMVKKLVILRAKVLKLCRIRCS